MKYLIHYPVLKSPHPIGAKHQYTKYKNKNKNNKLNATKSPITRVIKNKHKDKRENLQF